MEHRGALYIPTLYQCRDMLKKWEKRLKTSSFFHLCVSKETFFYHVRWLVWHFLVQMHLNIKTSRWYSQNSKHNINLLYHLTVKQPFKSEKQQWVCLWYEQINMDCRGWRWSVPGIYWPEMVSILLYLFPALGFTALPACVFMAP